MDSKRSGGYWDFLVVRHSERMDEVDRHRWKAYCDERSMMRDQYSLRNDPLITENGASIAKDAASTVKRIITAGELKCSSGGSIGGYEQPEVMLYSSKFMRCVQTAQCLAEELELPIYASSGLGLTAIAAAKGGFQFLGVDDLKRECGLSDRVYLIDADTTVDSDESCGDVWSLSADGSGKQPAEQSLLVDSTPPRAMRPAKSIGVSSDDWLSAIESILELSIASNCSIGDEGDVSYNTKPPVPIIVAHRETIRNLCQQHMRLPYCAIGVFRYCIHGESEKREIYPLRLLDKDGVVIMEFPPAPHPVPRL